MWFGRVVAAIVDVQPVCTGAPSDGTGLCDVVRECAAREVGAVVGCCDVAG